MDIKNVFRMPTPVRITGRTSSITNSFVNGIIPCIVPTEAEIQKVLEVLGMNERTIRCAYCDDTYTEWDHFHPLIRNKRQTGYISEIRNLVPSCGKCNQSKGNSYWKEWIQGYARLSPTTRNNENLNVIINRLEKYEAWSSPTIIDFESIVGKDIWEQHWTNCEKIHEMMRESQKLSDNIKITIAQKIVQTTDIEPNIAIMTQHPKLPIEDRVNPIERKVGIIAQTELQEILESNHISIDEIKLLLTQKYSKKTFDLQFPLLKELDSTKSLDEQKKDHKGRNRYYKSLITIHGKKYLFCSQWYENNRPHLIKWIALHG